MSKLPEPEPKRMVHKDHTVIVPPNTLKAKALVRAKNGQQEVDEMVSRADRALEALAPSFSEWMGNEILRLFEAIDTFEASDRGREAARSFFMVVHDVRGQAFQFGYPLAGRLAGGLCELLETQDDLPLPPVLMRRYVESIASIVRAGIRDESNAVATELVRTLSKVVADYRAKVAEARTAARG